MKTIKIIIIVAFLIFANTIKAQFSSPTIIDTSLNASVTNILVTDLNNDSQKDILVSYLNSSVFWYKNNNLNFQIQPNIINSLGLINHLDVADIDGNGFKDVLISSKGNPTKIVLMKNMYNGSTWQETLIDSNITLTVVRSYFEDMDKDGDLDIISCHDLDIAIYYNNGNGIFSGRNVVATGSEYYNLVVKDFNGDGLKDFVTHTGHGTQLFIATNNNTYTSQLLNANIFSYLETADVDNDGDYDLFIPNKQYGDRIDTYTNNGTGIFSLLQSTSFACGQHEKATIRIGKLNIDNYDDAVYKITTQQGLYYKENDLLGNFLVQKLIDTTYNYVNLQLGDLNNDGKNDIVWFASVGSTYRYVGFTLNQILILSTSNENSNEEKNIYPNPVNKTLFISNTDNLKGNASLINTEGKTILEWKNIPKEIDFSHLPIGIYFLTIKKKTYKVIKN